MKYFKLVLSIIVLCFFVPHVNVASDIGYIYPAGVQQGETVTITIGGQKLKNIKKISISGGGVTINNVEYFDSVERLWGQIRGHRNVIQSLIGQDKNTIKLNEKYKGRRDLFEKYKAMSDDELKAELRNKSMEIKAMSKVRNDPKKQPNAQIAERLKVELTIDKNARRGEREVRLITSQGASNPMVFYIDNLPEMNENENEILKAIYDGKLSKVKLSKNMKIKKTPPTEIDSLPVVINGQIMPGETDQFIFDARKGQKLTFVVRAQALVPYLADAVPGWFQAVIGIYDAEGKEVAYEDDYKFNPDPVLFFNVPKTGEYTLKIRDSIYRGREDFVYRIAMGEMPYVTSVFPLGGRSGENIKVKIFGRNLPKKEMTVRSKTSKSYTILPPLKKGNLYSNPTKFAISSLPEKLEKEPNSKKGQVIKLPTIINGRILTKTDSDMYTFYGKKGQKIAAEVHARRLNSPLDSMLILKNSKGKILQQNDDCVDKGCGLLTHHADSYLTNTLPADGTYSVTIRDTQSKGGESYAYRLRISKVQPDFELRLVPSKLAIPQGGRAAVTVYALRRDGFNGEIKLSCKNMPDDFDFDNAVIPAGQDKIKMTMTASKSLNVGHHKPEIQGVAIVNKKKIIRDAVPTEDVMQAFLYRHLVPSKDFFVTVVKQFKLALEVDLKEDEVLKIPAGGNTRFYMISKFPSYVKKNWNKGRGKGKGNAKNKKNQANQYLTLALDDPIKGLSIKSSKINPSKDKTYVTIYANESDLKPGVRGNLIMTANMGKGKKVICTAPAIPFEIIANNTKKADSK